MHILCNLGISTNLLTPSIPLLAAWALIWQKLLLTPCIPTFAAWALSPATASPVHSWRLTLRLNCSHCHLCYHIPPWGRLPLNQLLAIWACYHPLCCILQGCYHHNSQLSPVQHLLRWIRLNTIHDETASTQWKTT
jgi:hypothetical protein